MIALQNYKKCFLFNRKISFRSRDIQIFVIFSLPLHTSQISRGQMEVEQSMMPGIGLHKLADVIFAITQKTLYITSSNLVR